MNSNLRAKNLLHIENLYKRYGDHMVLDDIDLSVAEGEFCTVVGPSGCGKTTLLKMIDGLIPYDSGHGLWEDWKRCSDFHPHARRGVHLESYKFLVEPTRR